MRDSMVFYGSWLEAIKNLPREMQGEVLTSIIEYGLSGEATESLKPITKAMLAMVKPQIESNWRRYENGVKGAEHGNKGGAPKGNKNAIKTTPKQPQNNPKTTPKDEKTTPNVYVYDNDINNSISNDIELFVEVPEEPRHNPDDPIDYKKLIDYFNDETKGVFGKIKYPLSDKRKGHIRARIREHGKDAMAEVIKKATASSFLKGSSGKFKATFDWMILPTNFEKILSGNFDEQANEKGKQRYVVS